jgi:hypothetical protein
MDSVIRMSNGTYSLGELDHNFVNDVDTFTNSGHEPLQNGWQGDTLAAPEGWTSLKNSVASEIVAPGYLQNVTGAYSQQLARYPRQSWWH